MAAKADKKTATPAQPEIKQPDASMEDILHSIRDIIAEKTENGAAAPVADDDDEVLELTQVVNAEPAGIDVLQDIDAALEEEAEPEPEPVAPTPPPVIEQKAAPVAVAPEREPEPEMAEEELQEEPEEIEEEPAPKPLAKQGRKGHLVSDEPAGEASAALKTLLKNIPKPQVKSKSFRSGDTVEDLVVETLKPMLSAWLDENLPIIVRELVQKEIEKLVPHETRD